MTESIYIDTSIAGYLTDRSSNNLILMANMEITRQWWESRRGNFNIYISEVVLDEAALGDAEIAAKRLEILSNFPLLELNDTVE